MHWLGVGMLKNKLVRKELELDGDFKPDFLSTCEVHMKTRLDLYVQDQIIPWPQAYQMRMGSSIRDRGGGQHPMLMCFEHQLYIGDLGGMLPNKF